MGIDRFVHDFYGQTEDEIAGVDGLVAVLCQRCESVESMKEASPPPIDLAKTNAKLQSWRKKYNTPAKVAAEHRKKILDWVVESMAFDGEPVSKARLKALLKAKGKKIS